MNSRINVLALFLGTLFLAAGCAPQDNEQMDQNQAAATHYTKAVAFVQSSADQGVSGAVHFEKVEDGVNVSAEVSGLEPGKHGFHIHEYGDCTAGDFTSAGGHFNPGGTEHGAPTDNIRHMGDMGNLAVGEDGNATIDYVDPVIKLNGKDGVIGRAVIIHAGADDLESQPSGAAGNRIACGVIGIDQVEGEAMGGN